MVRAPGAGGWQRRPQARADSVLFAEPPQPKRRVFLRRKPDLAAPAQRGPEVVPAKSDMRMVLALLTSLRSFSSFWHGIARKRSLLVLRASVDIKSTEKAATMSRVFCTFFPQKGTQKLPGRCLRIQRAVLTLAPGARLKGGFKGRWAAERVISDTTLSLLKPASYAGARAFSRAFVSRLRHRAGIVRRGTRREGCVRDKQEAQKPTIAPGSGFKPPHSRLQRRKNNRQPACPEREAA